MQDHAPPGEWHAHRAASPTFRSTKNARVRRAQLLSARAASAISSAARTIRSASTRARSRWESNVRNATKANSCAAAFRRGRGAGRIFYGCSRYPDCDFTTPHEPINEPCPKCGAPFIVEKRTKQGNFRSCIKEGCDWEIEAPATAEGATDATAAAPPVSTPRHRLLVLFIRRNLRRLALATNPDSRRPPVANFVVIRPANRRRSRAPRQILIRFFAAPASPKPTHPARPAPRSPENTRSRNAARQSATASSPPCGSRRTKSEMSPPIARDSATIPRRQSQIHDAQNSKSKSDAEFRRILAPSFPGRPQFPRIWQQFDARRKPHRRNSTRRHENISAQRIPRRPFRREISKLAIQHRSHL